MTLIKLSKISCNNTILFSPISIIMEMAGFELEVFVILNVLHC